MDFDEEMRKLWAEYHTAREAADPAYDFEALAKRVRSVRSAAKTDGFTVVHEQLGDLAEYVKLARAHSMTPMQRLRAYWPALDPSVIEGAIEHAEAALARGAVSQLRRAASRLRCTDQPEHLAGIAEDGLAGEFAALIPGACEDEGMLVLSPEHEALIERGRRTLGRVETAIAARRGSS
ncbi:MAG: hypothetical protein M3680_08505 [Myxococcota bacterium]|nr:hypothetical protein [Myxococcota bacterium]